MSEDYFSRRVSGGFTHALTQPFVSLKEELESVVKPYFLRLRIAIGSRRIAEIRLAVNYYSADTVTLGSTNSMIHVSHLK